MLARLVDAFPLAPRSYALCQDHSILGCDFHIMERRHGFVVRRDLPPAFRDQPELNRRLSETIVDTLAALHGVDPESVGLGELGRPEGFLDRQLTGWVRRWQATRDAAAGDDDRVDRLAAWLQRNVPSSRYATLLHHDYKLDNMLVETTDPATPVAVLDWDMATRGDPLVELGYLLIFWAEATDDPAWIEAAAMPTHYPGGLTRADVVARYADRTGFDVTHIRWYHVFGLFKLIVILQQIYVRYVRGQTQDQRFARFGRRVDGLIAKAWLLLSERETLHRRGDRMAVDITQRDVGTVTILDLAGKLAGDGGDTLFKTIDDVTGSGRRELVLNLVDVTFVDSASLGGLLSKRNEIMGAGGHLKLLNATARISDLLVTTKLEMVFDTFDTEDDAVRSFAS